MTAYRIVFAYIAAALMLTVSALASAATVTITDLSEGIPTVAFSGFPLGTIPV